jgi:hypothetical protein
MSRFPFDPGPSFKSRCILLLLVIMQLSCGRGPDRLSGITAAFSSDGALNLAARLRSGEGEGGGWWYISFLHARKNIDGSMTRSELDVEGSSRNAYCDDLTHAYMEGSTERYLLIDTGLGLSLWREQSGGWTWLGTDDGLTPEARQMTSQKLLAAWNEQDAVRMLSDRWLYRLEGDRIVDAMSVSGSCSSARLCYVAPGPTTNETRAVTLSGTEMSMSQLTCDAGQGQCSWDDTGTPLGTGDLGGTSCPRGRFFFHTYDAAGTLTPVFVRTVRPASGDPYRVQANTPDGELGLVDQNAYFLGAAALPAGGYAVAVEDYDMQLSVVLVQPDLTTKQIVKLGRQPDGFMNVSLTVLGSGTSSVDQRAHVFFGVGVSIVRHLTIIPDSGAIEDDELIDLRE